MADQVSNSGGGATFDKFVSSLSGAQVIASKGASNASVKASKTTSFSTPNLDGVSTAHFSVVSLTASAPLNKNSDDTDIASLDGLGNAASLELTYSHFLVPGKRNPVVTPGVLQRLDSICARVYQEMKRQTGNSPETGHGCESAEVAKYGTATDKHDYESAFWDIENTNRWIWGGNVKLGYQNFDFIDATTMSKQKQDETPWAVGAFIAYNPDKLRALFTFSAQYQDAFKDSSSGILCPSSSSSMGGAVSCLSGAINRPKETKKKLLSFEARRDFGFAGIGLTTTYDLEEEIFGAELPVYFVKDKDGKFNAGLKGGWRNDTKDFTASVFVGTTFGLFK